VKWPCGSVNQREGTSGQFKMQKQQTMLAVLSLGPVGISDQLSGRPSEPGVTTTSNVSLVMSTCAATGDLLQPSYPLTVLDRSLGGQTGDIELWGTYTAVGAASSLGHGGMPAQVEATATLQVWYLAMLFQFGKAQRTPKNGLPSLQVLESDLAPMVDESHVTPSFSDVPVASFANMGTNLTGEYVVWTADFLSTQRSENACAAVTLSAWAGSYNVSVEPQGSLAHLAPVMGGGGGGSGGAVALLGEAGKVCPVSTYRFASVTPSAKQVQVTMRGKPAELVQLLYATKSGREWACKASTATIGSDGSVTVTLA
jgi:hypothetical protein